jgi:Domain of unknown function (DUF222)/HNH endonuclease
MFDTDVAPDDVAGHDLAAPDIDADTFLAWLDEAGELDPPPAADEPLYEDEFRDPGVLDPRALSTDRQLGRLVAADKQIAALHAEQQQLLAALADGDDSVEGWSAEWVSCALRIPSRTAQQLVATAQTLTGQLPRTLSALASGDLTLRHAQVIAEAACRLPAEHAGQLEHRVLERAARQTVAQLRAAVRRTVLALDPRTAEQRHRLARQDRTVELRPVEDGMTELRALLPAPDAETIYRRLCDATRLLPAADDRTTGQQRADLLIDAILSGIPADALPEHHGRRPTINILIPLSTLLGHDDQPGWLDNYGPITAGQARHLASDPTGTWRRLITDPITGQLLDHGTTTYRPPQTLTDHIITRDPACAFPTCQQPSHRGDLDHIHPYARGGPTNPTNLAPLCRRHHQAKTRGTFDYHRNPDGTFTWTDPHGNTYTSTPTTRWTVPNQNTSKPKSTDDHDAPDEAAPETAEQRQTRLRQAQDDSYQRLTGKLETEIKHATQHHDPTATTQAQTALTAARQQYKRILRNRDDPEYPPF